MPIPVSDPKLTWITKQNKEESSTGRQHRMRPCKRTWRAWELWREIPVRAPLVGDLNLGSASLLLFLLLLLSSLQWRLVLNGCRFTAHGSNLKRIWRFWPLLNYTSLRLINSLSLCRDREKEKEKKRELVNGNRWRRTVREGYIWQWYPLLILKWSHCRWLI